MTYAEALKELSAQQARASINILGPISDWDHVQASVSKVDGNAVVEAFVGRRGVRILVGKRGGVKSNSAFKVE